MNATCHSTWLWNKQEHACCKIILLELFLMAVKHYGVTFTATKLKSIYQHSVVGFVTGFMTLVFLSEIKHGFVVFEKQWLPLRF